MRDHRSTAWPSTNSRIVIVAARWPGGTNGTINPVVAIVQAFPDPLTFPCLAKNRRAGRSIGIFGGKRHCGTNIWPKAVVHHRLDEPAMSFSR
jgi:hypothetical protein